MNTTSCAHLPCQTLVSVIELSNRYHKSHLYIIDVSQSVEHDHPAAFDFLRADIKNVDEFWARRGAKTLGLRGTFDFVVSNKVVPITSDEECEETNAALRAILIALVEAKAAPTERYPQETTDTLNSETHNVPAPHAPEILSQAGMQHIEEQHSGLPSNGADEQLEDAVFLRSYIPRNLNEVFDPERDTAKVRRGEGGDLIYGAITGVVQANEPLSRVEIRGDPLRSASGQKVDAHAIEESGEDTDGSDGDEDDETEEGSGDTETNSKKRAPRGHRHEDKDAKKVRHYCPQQAHPAESAHSKGAKEGRQRGSEGKAENEALQV